MRAQAMSKLNSTIVTRFLFMAKLPGESPIREGVGFNRAVVKAFAVLRMAMEEGLRWSARVDGDARCHVS